MLKRIKKYFSTRRTYKSAIKEYEELIKQASLTKKRFKLDPSNFYFCLDDKTSFTGFDRHYIYHPAWAARIVKKIHPDKHVDISSTLHFCSILSAFVPVDFYDYRPAKLYLDSLQSKHADLLQLPFANNSVSCISCMHTVEHIGLARYGDPLDYDGDIKAIQELKRVVAPGGNLLFVVPLGADNVLCFNAHRIYTKEQVMQLFSDMELKEFALIPEDERDGGLVIDPDEALLNKQFYACGCFWFSKRVDQS